MEVFVFFNYFHIFLSWRTVLSYLLFIGSVHASSAEKWDFMIPPVNEAPAVVEFFSFYCPPCYAFSQTLKIDDAIRGILPEKAKMIKYHVSFLGPLGPKLTQAWALAIVMNKAPEVEKAFFKAKMVDHTLNGVDDIRNIFISSTGISAEEYDQKINSTEVMNMVKQQERLFKEYNVRGTPSVYVYGQYHINNGAFKASTIDGFRNAYVSTVEKLLTHKDASS